VSRSGEIARAFLEQGWEVRYRGGNAMCSTPSDLDLVVADAPGDPPRYSIAAWPSSVEPPGGPGGAAFDLYDAERGVTARVHRVPTPERAAELLGRYGVPDEEARDAPLVP
jgi:hypothetical protein